MNVKDKWEAIAFLTPMKDTIKKLGSDPDRCRESISAITYEDFVKWAAEMNISVTPELYDIALRFVDVFTQPGQAEHYLKCVEIYETCQDHFFSVGSVCNG